MGIYYRLCNLDRKEYMASPGFDHGYKLHEIALSRHGMMSGLALLLALNGSALVEPKEPILGRWAGDRIVLVSDNYEGPLCGREWTEDDYFNAIEQRDGWVDITEHVVAELNARWDLKLPLDYDDDWEQPRSILHPDGRITPVALTPDKPD